MASKVVANASDVEKLAAFGAESDVAALHGWRFDLFGKVALKVRGGDIALTVGTKGVELVELEPE